MRISLSKDPSSPPGEILAHVDASASDNPTDLRYSHSFRYKVPSGKDGEIIVYAAKEAAFKDMKGDVFLFDLEKCHNKDCKAKNPDGCPIIAGKDNRLLVANVFHTMPTHNTLQYFGTALFKALFSGEAGRLLQKTKTMNGDGPIFLQLNDQDLDAIPWEYAKDGTTFLVHTRKFTRVIATGEYDELPPDRLPKLPLRIVVAAPDPLDIPELKLADLHLSDQVQNFINEFRGASIKIMLERVLPATVNKMNLLLAKHNDKMATVFHFMGHCVSHKDDKKARGLLFEDEDTFQCEIAYTQNLVTIPKHLRLAFLSACDSREVARDLAQNGVRQTIGSYCPLPDDIARKSEAQFYQFLAQGLSIDEAMWRTRMYFQHRKELRQSDYLVGAMILYSTTCQTMDNAFLYKSGHLTIEDNMFPNNITMTFARGNLFGRKEQLAKLNNVLRRMATRTHNSYNMCTITGIGGQGKTMLAKEAISRACHFFPGGIFVWRFDNEREISAGGYLRGLAKVLFPNDALNDVDEMEKLGQDISNRFQASCLLILDHAETLKRAAAEAKKDAEFLVDWLQRILLNRDISVKILATSQENLGWPREELVSLDGLTDSDIHYGCRLFVENLHSAAKAKMEKEKNSKHLLRELVKAVDGHPLTLKLLGDAVASPNYLDNSLEDIVREHYCAMLVNSDAAKKCLEERFGPMIDGLSKPQHQILYLCCLFTGPITDRVLLFLIYFLDGSADDFNAETIMAQLQILSERGLLKQMKDNSYSIQVALKEAVRQRNTGLRLRLCLQTSSDYADAFVIGVLISSPLRKSRVLQWLFRNLKSNCTSHLRTKNFGIEYYSLENTDWAIINLAEATMQHKPPTQLIVFICKISEILRNDQYMLREDQISSIVTVRKLPFILCLDRTNAEGSAIKMKNAATILRTSLANTHHIIVADVPSEATSKFPTISTKSSHLYNKTVLRQYQISLTDVSMEGSFIGREKELETLHTLLKDNTYQYITIKGFGGIGKTCLAIQAAKNFNSGNILALSLIGIPALSSVIRKITRFLGIETKEWELHDQKTAVIEKLNGEEIILLYLDNMEDIKNAMDGGNSEAKDLMNFFKRMPENVKILATSRVALGWPNEKIVELDGLTPPDGVKIFQQWSSQRKNDIDNESALKLSEIVHGHSLSLRLLGGVFDNCDEPMDNFLKNISNRLSTAVESSSVTKRHESINACIKYSFDILDPTLRSRLGQLRSFEIPFCKTIAARALGLGTTLIANSLHNLWQRSWLNLRIYQEDPMLGDWRPRSIENDIKFYSLHPRLRDFLDEQFKNTNSDLLNDIEIQFYTALCYGVGFGVLNNLEKQIEWCKKAADNEHLEAQLILALCYESGGGGVGEDEKEALHWYLKAAKACDKAVQQEMSRRFYWGWGFKEGEYIRKYWRKLCNDTETEPLKIKFDFSLPLVHRATEYGAMDLVRSLMEQRLAKVDIKDGHGRTPLHVAAEKGRTDIFQLLALEFDANINATTKDGRTPLHIAMDNGHSDVVRLVAELGADVNAKDKNGGTPFHRAARAGHVEVMKVLEIDFGVDINVKDEKGQTPIHWALRSGQIEAVKFLMARLHPMELNFQGMLYGMSKSDMDVGEIQLTCAYLLGNSIGAEGARALGESLKQNTTLTQLNLEGNSIGAEGARALGESLKQNTTLTQLNLRGNGIRNEGARALGESLKLNTTLTQLNLEYNDIGAEGVRALGESLKQNTTLTQLNLEGNSVLLNNIADIYFNQKMYDKAEPLYKRVAGLYESQGKYNEAEPLYQRALAIRETVLGPKHPDIAIFLNSLARLYESQGKYDEAEPLYQRALAIREKELGPEHPDTVVLLNNIADIYFNQKTYDKAEPLYKRVAGLYESQGKYNEAEPLYQRTLAIRETVLGPKHPDIAILLNSLARLCESQGKYDEAEPLYQRALVIRERVLGPEHPDTVVLLNNIADIKFNQKMYDKAELLYKRVAGLYESQGKYNEAEPLYQRALEIREKVLGPEHPDTVISLNSLARLYESQGKYDEAEPLYQRALAIREKVLGPEHPDTVVLLNNVADIYFNQKVYDKAEPLYKQVAGLYESQGKYNEAEPLYQRALEICEKVLGPEHPDTVISLNSLARLYHSQGKYNEAEPLYQRALAIRKVLESEHPDTATSLLQATHTTMRISLVKDDPSLTLAETLVHVQVSKIDDPPAFEYSHSFKYKVPSGTDEKSNLFGEVIIYTDKNAASGGTSFPFELEKCRNKDCQKEKCPAKPHRLLVADVFHTKPKWLVLQEFGAALFRALFSGYAGQLLQKTKSKDSNRRIYLQLNSNVDLDAIPWEYANNHTKFLIHQCIFARIQEHPRNMLPKYPLRIIVPDPVVPPEKPGADLPDLRLNEQFRNFINMFTKNKKAVKLERVFPPTIQQMERQLMKERETATVLHFMGHCGQKGPDSPRALIFENNDNGGLDYIDASRLASTSDNLRLAFLSTSDSGDIARALAERVPYVIGSNCSIPDNLACKFEQEFYNFLTGGSTVERAMGQARVSLWNSDDIRHSYFAGAMVLYSSISGEDDGVFKCEDGDPNIQLHEPLHNLMELPTALRFHGYRKELSKLYTDLKCMVERSTQISHVYTVKGVEGPKFVAEAMKRMAHLFPGGIFAWAFHKERTSALGYFQRLVDVIFSTEVGSRLKEQSGNDDGKLGTAIIQQFQTHATCLLILDQADILDFGRKGKNLHAEKLGSWLEKVTSVRDTVKILLISQKPLDWLKGELMDLNDSTNPIIINRRNSDSYFEHYSSTINHPQAGKYFYGIPRKNYGFVDRPEIIQKMYDALNMNSHSSRCNILALKGLGGIGKTQLMLQYCYLHAAEYDSIFWLTVNSWNTAVHAYCKMADYLGLDEATIEEKDSEKVINWVISWFEGRTKWLLLLDNADGEISEKIFELLPGKGGNIIFTTRQPTPSTRAKVISVDKMQVQEAILLLYGVSSMDLIDQKNADFNYAHEIVTEFDCLPLAVNLARAYVQQTGISLRDYLLKFREQKEHSQLLGHRDEDDSNQYEYIVTTVWQLSFERIEALNPATMQILKACAFLRPENIPASLFKKRYAALELKLPVSAISPNEQDEEFSQIIEEAITMLADYSFVRKMKINDDEGENPTNDVLVIYRLVQKVIYNSIVHEERLDWVRKIVAALCTETYIEASRESYNRKIMDVYVPHIRHLVALINESDWKSFSSERLHVLLYQVLHHLIVNEKGFGDEELLQTLVKVTEKVFGAEHEYSLVSLSELASFYTNMGKYSEAEAIYRQVLAIRGKTLNESVSLLASFALLCKRQGNFKEAEMLYIRVLAIIENSGSPLTAAILNDLGEFYISLGSYDKAEEFHKRALTICKNDFGPDDVVTAESLNNLAVLYEIRGNYGESETLQKRALVIRESELGPEHTHIASSMTNLAVLHRIRGKYNEAEPLFKGALVMFKKLCGPANPRTATCLYHLAVLYESQGKSEEAMPISQKALNIRWKVSGPEHPETAQSLNNLGNIYYGLGTYDEAERLYKKALEICKNVLGLEHPETATPLVSLASLYNDQGKYNNAEPLYNKALAIRKKALGSEHPDTATALHGLASLYNDQGKYDEAKPLYQRALAIREKVLGPEHPDIVQSLNNLGNIYYGLGKLDEAEKLYNQALSICKKALRLEHPDTASALHGLASLYKGQNKHDEAESLYNQALAIREKALGLEHPDTATALHGLASLYNDQGKYDEAKPLYERALVIRLKVLGSEHSCTAILWDSLASLREKALRLEHPDTPTSLDNLVLDGKKHLQTSTQKMPKRSSCPIPIVRSLLKSLLSFLARLIHLIVATRSRYLFKWLRTNLRKVFPLCVTLILISNRAAIQNLLRRMIQNISFMSEPRFY